MLVNRTRFPSGESSGPYSGTVSSVTRTMPVPSVPVTHTSSFPASPYSGVGPRSSAAFVPSAESE